MTLLIGEDLYDPHSDKFLLNETIIMLNFEWGVIHFSKAIIRPNNPGPHLSNLSLLLGGKVLEMVVGLEFQVSTPDHWIQIAFTHNCETRAVIVQPSCFFLSLSSFQYLQLWYPSGPAKEIDSD